MYCGASETETKKNSDIVPKNQRIIVYIDQNNCDDHVGRNRAALIKHGEHWNLHFP